MEIAAVPGIDVVHVGSNDLLTQMGLSDEMGKEKHFALAQRVLDACRKHGKIFGIGGVRTPEIQSRFIAMGAQMMTTNSDIAFLMSAAKESARALRFGRNARVDRQRPDANGDDEFEISTA